MSSVQSKEKDPGTSFRIPSNQDVPYFHALNEYQSLHNEICFPSRHPLKILRASHLLPRHWRACYEPPPVGALERLSRLLHLTSSNLLLPITLRSNPQNHVESFSSLLELPRSHLHPIPLLRILPLVMPYNNAAIPAPEEITGQAALPRESTHSMLFATLLTFMSSQWPVSKR